MKAAADDRTGQRAKFWPTAPVWFRHRVGRVRHLGIAVPDSERATIRRFVDLGPRDPIEALARGELTAECLAARAEAGAEMASEPVYDLPVDRPGKILCLGKNFAAHAAEFGHAVPEEPIVFTKLVDTLLPHGATIQLPPWVRSRIDHELELAVLVGTDHAAPGDHRDGYRDLSVESAPRIVAGYTVFNDVTARTIQGEDRQAQRPWLRSKSYDTFGPLGPFVVPTGSIDPNAGLDMELSVNGELRQQANTSQMVVSIAAAIAWLSNHTTLRPGDLIAMGTPAGVSPLAEGDEVIASIEGIGRLRNDVQRRPLPGDSESREA